MISFIIKGKPKALKRHRSTRKGIMYDPSKKDKQEIWMQIAKNKPKQPLKGQIYLKLIFYMPRPKNHYRTGKYKHLLKDRFIDVEHHIAKPDIDNLIKMIADTIQGKRRIIYDDSQICRLQAEKLYSKKPRTEVVIQEIA